MKKDRFKLILGFVAVQALTACTGVVGERFQKALVDNQSASSLEEWMASENHSDKIFAEFRNELAADIKSTGRSDIHVKVCSELSALDDQSLTQFEENIDDRENNELLVACKESLKKRLDKYYAENIPESEKLNSWSARANFKFPTREIKRDFSKGYFAVTGDVGPKEIVLTFDDGPQGQYTPMILDALKAVNAKAIFFTLGKAAKINPTLVKRLAAEGHMVGSHTNSHLCIGSQRQCRASNGGRLLPYSQGVSEINLGHNIVHDILGYTDPFFRFPYGGSSPELKQYLAANQVSEFFWSVDSADWKTQTPEQLVERTIRDIEKAGRGVVLFHDIQRRTAVALPAILSRLYNKGYNIVLLKPMDENSKYRKIGTRN